MKREYFISFISTKDEKFRYSHRVIIVKDGNFNINKVIKFLEEADKCKDIVILNFKELKSYEK